MKEQGRLSIHDSFAGKGVLLTGSTGFLAKAVVEKILRDLPDIGQIFLLIRARVRRDGSRVDPRERLREEILRNSAFGRLREQLGDDFEGFCESRITCVPGDLTAPRLGLDEAAFADLSGKVHLVINSAATVVFDERLDWALDLNTLGPQRLLELAKAAGCPYVHISTAYVSGMRTGLIPERLLDPLEAVNAQLPRGVPRPEKFDVNEEVARLAELAQDITRDCRKLCEKKGLAPESEEAATQLRQALVSAGMRRAQGLGWNDTYTYTKFLGEQLVKQNHKPVGTVIVRPAIIESSLFEPEPGWLDGLRMADPLIIGFGKGRLPDFPADQNVVLDIIPADLVVNGILAASAYVSANPGIFDLFTIASSSENPLSFRSLYEHVRDYFRKHPMTDRAGKPVSVPSWRFPTVAQYRSRMRNRYLPLRAAQSILNGPFPLPGMRKVRARLRSINTKLEQLLYYVDIYGPYVTLDCRFETAHARELLERLAPEERSKFDFDPRRIRWKNYIQDVHIPGLKRNILRMDAVPRTGAGEGHLLDEESEAIKRRRGAAAKTIRGVPQTVVDLCERGHERFGDKALLELRRKGTAGGGPEHVRISYSAMFERSGELARLLIARLGLHPGDRLALAGENCPEWALAYLAIARACCTAVPLDPGLPPKDAARLIKLVEAKAVLLSPELFEEFRRELGSGAGLPPCLNLRASLAPHAGETWRYPEASLGDRPLKDPAPETLASILFTSGTTYEPKGVMLTHANLVADALSVAEVLEPLESDRFLSVLPLHHALEFTGGFLIPMYGGSTIHHLERIQDVSDTMKSARITVIVGVPRLFQLFMDRIRGRLAAAGLAKRFQASLGHAMAGAWEMAFSPDSSVRKRLFREVHAAFGGHLRLLVSGGAALDPEVFHFFRSFGITIVEGYGLTETAPVLTVNPLSAPKAGSVGPPVPGMEIRINNPDYEGIGEVLARGPTIMQGYWHNPAATERAFESGWLKTGDLGRIGTDGYLSITGRLKDVIITAAGKNVYPDEVEAHLQKIGGIKELCVMGLPARAGRGEEVAAIIVPEPDAARANIKAALDRVLRSLPSHQRPARIEFQEDGLPKTTTLKVQRNKVRERYSGPGSARTTGVPPVALSGTGVPPVASGSPQAAESSLLLEVARAVAEVTQLPEGPGRMPSEITPDMRLQLDLGIDSIGRVDLLQKLELQLNLTIPHEAEGKLFTVRDLVSVVESVRAAGASPLTLPSPQGGEGGVRGRRGKGLLSRRTDQQELQAGLQGSLSRSILQGVLSTTASVLMNMYLRIDYKGLENLPESGAYILAANHCSHLDAVAVREALGHRAADLFVMGAKDYFFDTRLKSWFFSTFLNALPFDREDTAAQGLATCKTVLDAGRAILLFPEGTRSVTGDLQAFKPGVGVLGIELDVPVIPVLLRGTFAALPKGRALPRPARISLRIGKPLLFEALKKERGSTPATDLYRRAASELRAQIEALAQSPQ